MGLSGFHPPLASVFYVFQRLTCSKQEANVYQYSGRMKRCELIFFKKPLKICFLSRFERLGSKRALIWEQQHLKDKRLLLVIKQKRWRIIESIFICLWTHTADSHSFSLVGFLICQYLCKNIFITRCNITVWKQNSAGITMSAIDHKINCWKIWTKKTKSTKHPIMIFKSTLFASVGSKCFTGNHERSKRSRGT